MEDNDTPIEGGEELSIEQAAAAYAEATSEEVTDQPDDEDQDEGELPADDDTQESDEDESEDADGEESDEDQAEDDDEEPESEGGRFVADNAKIRLSDGTITTVAELKQGSLRNADYTRKTQEVAEQRRAVESQSEAIQASQKEIETQRQLMTTLLQNIVPQAPDAAMLQTDPMGYMTQKAQHDEWVGYLNQLQADQQRTEQERQAKTAEEMRNKGQAEWQALLDKAPDLKDQKKADRFVKDAEELGQSLYGFTREEIGEFGLDHRKALALKDAIAWRKLQNAKPKVQKKVEGRPPVSKGGKRLNSSEHKARRSNDAITRLKKSGTVEDAAAAYIASLNKG